jgi:hypothetical protein
MIGGAHPGKVELAYALYKPKRGDTVEGVAPSWDEPEWFRDVTYLTWAEGDTIKTQTWQRVREYGLQYSTGEKFMWGGPLPMWSGVATGGLTMLGLTPAAGLAVTVIAWEMYLENLFSGIERESYTNSYISAQHYLEQP